MKLQVNVYNKHNMALYLFQAAIMLDEKHYKCKDAGKEKLEEYRTAARVLRELATEIRKTSAKEHLSKEDAKAIDAYLDTYDDIYISVKHIRLYALHSARYSPTEISEYISSKGWARVDKSKRFRDKAIGVQKYLVKLQQD